MSDAPSTKLSFREKFGYSLGDASANFVFQLFIFFPTAFYVETMGISAAAMGTMLLLVRFSDAITDPVMGYIADRTNHRWGKFRPWLLWSAIPFALLFWIAFTVPETFSPTGKLLYAAITYTLLMMAYTMNNVPYSALNGVMTVDQLERTSVSSYRFFSAMVAGFFVSGFTLPLVDKFGNGDPARGWSMAIGLMAIISVIFFVITFFSVKERVKPPASQKPNLKQDFRDIAKNRPWIAMFGMTFFVFVTLSLRGNASYLHMTYYIDDEAIRSMLVSLGLIATEAELASAGLGLRLLDIFGLVITPESNPSNVGISVFNMTGSLITIGGVLAAKPLAALFGKKAVFTVGLALAAFFQSLNFFLRPDDIPFMFALTILVSLSYGPTIPLLWAMIADCADWGQWKLGRRSTGFVFSGMVFALKAGLGIGGALAGWLLAMYGYSPETATEPGVLLGIRALVGFYSGGFFFLGVIFMLFYPINKKTALKMGEALKLRQSDAS